MSHETINGHYYASSCLTYTNNSPNSEVSHLWYLYLLLEDSKIILFLCTFAKNDIKTYQVSFKVNVLIIEGWQLTQTVAFIYRKIDHSYQIMLTQTDTWIIIIICWQFINTVHFLVLVFLCIFLDVEELLSAGPLLWVPLSLLLWVQADHAISGGLGVRLLKTN